MVKRPNKIFLFLLLDKSDDNLDVELKVNEENEIVEADTPDEFFVCGYQVEKEIYQKNQCYYSSNQI